MAIAWLATHRLTSAELGFFFAFLSFGALVQLADFGLSYASLQTAGSLAGTGRLSELPSLATRVRRWNLAATTVTVLGVAVVGAATFSARSSGASANGVTWEGPWIGYLAAVFLVQLAAPAISLREGGGKITQMWRLRLAQEWSGSIVCLVALAAGAGLWSLSAFAFTRAAVAGIWLNFGDPLRPARGEETYSLRRWMSEVWPFQWKIGLSGLSGYLIYRAFSPIILLEKGPIVAGQFGLAISMMNLLIAVSTAWPMSQAARYSSMMAAGRFDELRREFPRLFWSSTGLAVLATGAATVAVAAARSARLPFALHFPDALTTGVVLAAAVAHHAVICMAMFLRSEGREPLLPTSIAGALVTVVAIWLASRFGTPRDIAITNLVCGLAGVPIAVVFLSWRQRSLLREIGIRSGDPTVQRITDK